MEENERREMRSDFPDWHPAAGAAEDLTGSGASEPSADGGDGGSGRAAESEFTRAKNIVLNQLAASAKSRAQLEKKLNDRGISPDTAADVLDRFEAAKLVDDAEFAQMYVRSRATAKKLSRTAIRRELKDRGISGEIAELALEQRTEADERADARELVRKKLRPGTDLSQRTEREKTMRRLVGMLARRGYPQSLAINAVKHEMDRFCAENGAGQYPETP